MKPAVIMVLGILVFAAGTLFALQGAGVVNWPQESTMIGHRDWVEYGIVIALIGIALILTARRIRRS